MNFKFNHFNFNVKNLDESLKFYNEALGFSEYRRISEDDFTIVFLTDGSGTFALELTWIKEHPQPYELGECEFHLAVLTDDYETSLKKHTDMGCVCYNNEEMGLYFISDPDGYWIEIIPAK